MKNCDVWVSIRIHAGGWIIWGDSVGGKTKVGWWKLGFGDWLDGKLSGEGIQLVGSLWAKKVIDLRLKVCGVWLFNYLFICIVTLWLLCYYMVNWTLLWVDLELVIFASAKFLKLRGTSDNGWFWFRLGNCGAKGNVFVLC